MLKFFDSNRKNYLRRLETELNSRNVNQQGQLLKVKKILQNVKKKGDNAKISYEKNFSN